MNKVDSFIEQQELEISLIVSGIRDIILSCAEHIKEDIKYKIPFFSLHSGICYINVRNKVVDLGFVNGSALSNHQGALVTNDRKVVRTISFESVADIDKSLVRELLFEAIMIDEEKKKGYNSIE
jgi:hypothetical protein